MGLSANRAANSLNAGGGQGQFGAPPQTNPALPPQPFQPPHSPLPLTAQMPQAQPGMFPRLQAMSGQGGMGGFLSQILMHGMHNRQMASGLSPEDFQAQIEARRAARGLNHF